MEARKALAKALQILRGELQPPVRHDVDQNSVELENLVNKSGGRLQSGGKL